MNIVAVIGNLASDPELRHTPGGKPVCEFRIAVSRRESDTAADFFTVVAWERQAEICQEYLSKGSRVAVQGRLSHSTWEKDGQKRSKVEIVATRVDFLGSRRDAHEEIPEAPDPEAAPATDGEYNFT